MVASRRNDLRLLLAITLLSACGSSSTQSSSAETKTTSAAAEATGTTDAPTTTQPATTTTRRPTGNDEQTDCTVHEDFRDSDQDGFGTCEPRTVPVDSAAVLGAGQFLGVPAGAQCSVPPTRKSGYPFQVICKVSNFDGSEGEWKYTIGVDDLMSVAPAYIETKSAPLGRANCTETPPEGQFQKDSLSSAGRCLHFWASVFQFDANTGPCSFLANYGSQAHNRNYKFSDAIIRLDAKEPLGWGEDPGIWDERIPNNCGLLGPVVEGNLVEVWAVNIGVDSYDTVIGGSNTYTKFLLVDIVVYR